MYRVVIDARSVVPRKSGIGNYTDALISHLVPLARDMKFVVLRHPSATEPIVRHERVQERRFAGESKSWHTVFRLGRSRALPECDLYHAPGDLVPLGLRCPWIVTLHDVMWIEAPELASAFLPVRITNALWYRATFGYAVRGARRVIAISQAAADAIGRVFPRDAHKTEIIHHGIDHQRYSKAAAGPRSVIEPWIPAAKRYSLIVGQGSPYKNHAGMIRAFLSATEGDPDHLLVVVRRFSRFDREMRQVLSHPAARHKIVALPFVTNAELLALYAHARMLLFASHYEGFGLPALEAMCIGTPVLGSNTPAVREVTGSAALHPDPSSHSELVRDIRALDRDEALRARLIETGRQRARDFSWERCARSTLELYRSVLKA